MNVWEKREKEADAKKKNHSEDVDVGLVVFLR